jgi:hypothetical protein
LDFLHYDVTSDLRDRAVCMSFAITIPPISAATKITTSVCPVPNAGNAPPGQKPAMPQPIPKVAEPAISGRSKSRLAGR